jgi:hypothetical protein
VAGFHGLMRCRRTDASGGVARIRSSAPRSYLRPSARRDIDLNHWAENSPEICVSVLAVRGEEAQPGQSRP